MKLTKEDAAVIGLRFIAHRSRGNSFKECARMMGMGMADLKAALDAAVQYRMIEQEDLDQADIDAELTVLHNTEIQRTKNHDEEERDED